jgi:hypothetical protein
MWKENVSPALHLCLFVGIGCFVFIWVQRIKFATENVSLGFKQLTKCESITGAAVLELEKGQFDEA